MTKSEIGLEAEKVLRNTNNIVRNIPGLRRWNNSSIVVSLLEELKNNGEAKFIQFHTDFYLSISSSIPESAIAFVRSFVVIESMELDFIRGARKILFGKVGTG